MNQEVELKRISTLLSRFAEEVRIVNSNGEFSINIHAENVLLKMLNVAYDIELKNINYEKRKTFPAIDLRDDLSRIAFQISSTGTVEKVIDTLNEFKKHNLDKKYDKLYFYFLKGMGKRVVIDNPRIVRKLGNLKAENIHFLDHAKFYQELNQINNMEKIIKIRKLLDEQFADIYDPDSPLIENTSINIIEVLKKALNLEKANNPSMNMMKIEENIFSKCHYVQSVIFEGTNSIVNSDSYPLIDAVKISWNLSYNKHKKYHISMYGIGGIGKTVSLLSLELGLPVVYIALNKTEDKTIREYIKESVLLEKEEYWTAFNNLCIEEWKERPSIVIILDGMNEISDDCRQSVFRELENEWQGKEGIQFIISSRYDVAMNFYTMEFLQLKLKKLDRKKVSEYLDKLNISRPEKFDEIWDVIDTPLMLNLYAASEEMKKHIGRSNAITVWKSVNSGSIIWNYLQYLLYKYQMAHSKITIPAKVALFIAPYIAYKMQMEGLFSIDDISFSTKWIKEAFDTLNNLKSLPRNIDAIIMQYGENRSFLINQVYALLTRHLCLFYNNAGKMYWMHQHFRDALAAIYLYEMAQTEDLEGLVIWKRTMDPYVESFLGNLLQAEENGNTWDAIWERNRHSNKPMNLEFIERMLRIYKIAFGNNLSRVNFSGLDLRNVSLAGFKLDGTNKNHFSNTKIERGTLFDSGHRMRISSISWKPDGTQYLSASRDCSVKIWNSNGEVAVPELHSPHTYYIRDAKWCNTDNNKFVTAGDDGIVFLWEFRENRWTYRNLGYCNEWIYSLDWSSDGEKIVCGDKGGAVTVFSLYKEEKTKFYHQERQFVSRVLFLNDDYLVSGTDKGTLCIWKTNRSDPLREYSFSEPILELFCVKETGMLIVITQEGGYFCDLDLTIASSIRFQKFAEGRITAAALALHESELNCALFMPNAINIYRGICGNDGNYRLFNYTAHSVGVKEMGIVSCGAWDSSCKTLIIGTNSGSLWNAEIMKGEENHDRIVLKKMQNSNTCSARCSAWSSIGDYLVAGYDDCMIRLWNLSEKRCQRVFNGHKESVKCVIWDNDQRTFYSGSNDGRILQWDVNNEEYKRELYNGNSPINCILLNKHWIIAGDDSGNIIQCDLENDKNISISSVSTRTYSLIMLPENQYMISAGDDRKLYLWNVVDKPILIDCIESGHEREIRSGVFSKLANGVYTGANDKVLRFRGYDLTKNVFDKNSTVIKGEHRDFIYSVTISQNELYVVTGSTDSNMGFWDAESKRFISIGSEHEGFIWNVSASPLFKGNYYVASSSSDGTVRIWNVTHIKSDEEMKSDIVLETIPGMSITHCDFTGAVIEDDWLKKMIIMNGGIIDRDGESERASL